MPNQSLKHEQIKAFIRDAIISGKLKPGDRLPTQAEMEKIYGASHNTIREAVGSLVHEGLIVREQGRGTFVAERITKRAVIGVVLPHLYIRNPQGGYRGHEVTVPILSAIENEARENNANIVLRISNDDQDLEEKNVLDIIGQEVDGIIVFPIGRERAANYLRKVHKAGIPLVLVDRYIRTFQSHYVVTDNIKGAFEIVRTVKELGFDDISYLSLALQTTALEDRAEGIKMAESFGIKVRRFDVLAPNMSGVIESAYNAAQEWLKTAPEKAALIGSTSGTLAGAALAIQESGRSPENTFLACFDWIPPEVQQTKNLAIVSQPSEEIGSKAVQIIFEELAGDKSIKQLSLEPKIKVF